MDNVITSIDQLFDLVIAAFSSIITGSIFYTLVGFTIAIVVMVFIKRKKFAQRKNSLWNFLTNFHYILVLIAFLVTSPILGGIRSVHNIASKTINEYLQPTIEHQVETIQHAIVSEWQEYTGTVIASAQDTADRLIKKLHYIPGKDEFFGEKKAKFVNWLVDNIGSKIIGVTVNAMSSIANGGGAEPTGAEIEGDSFSIQKIRNMDYSGSGKIIAQSVNSSVLSYVNSFFIGFYLNMLFLFIACMVVPVSEMLFFNLWWKKRDLKK